MKKIWKVLLIVGALLVMSFTIASACENPPPTCPEGEVMVGTPVWSVVGTHQEIDVPAHLETRYGFGSFWSWTWRNWVDTDTCTPGWFGKGWNWKFRECRTVPATYKSVPVNDYDWTGYSCGVPEPTPEPVNEQCGRCSTKFVGWVTWVDRDGGCDGDYNNERVEYPGDERCVVPEPDMCEVEGLEDIAADDEKCVEPTVPVSLCRNTVYLLKGTRYPCYLNINYNTDKSSVLPDRFNGTDYMYGLCDNVWSCVLGWHKAEFEWKGADQYGANGAWEARCKIECLDCD